jgi:cobyrinic acid a,c-diamide synthase
MPPENWASKYIGLFLGALTDADACTPELKRVWNNGQIILEQCYGLVVMQVWEKSNNGEKKEFAGVRVHVEVKWC